MAYDYNRAKQVWDSMNDQQKKQYTEQNKNDANFQQFAQQYHEEKQQTAPRQVQANVNVDNLQNNQPQKQQQVINTQTESEQQPLAQRDANWVYTGNTEWEKEQRRKMLQDQSSNQWVTKTITPQEMQESINKAQDQIRNQNASQEFDSSRLTNPNAEVSVKEGNAAQTWTPDYEEDSEARMNEITNNLNAYWNTNKSYFSDRSTFNSTFHYNDRSDKQKALLDSFWKWTQDQVKANTYRSWDDVMIGFENWDITPDVMSYLRTYNEAAYDEWQKKMENQLNLRIANMATPPNPWNTVDLWNDLVKKLWLEQWDPYNIYDNWVWRCEQLWVFNMNNQLSSYIAEMDSVKNERTRAIQRTMSQWAWKKSQALINAEVAKTSAIYDTRFADLQRQYQAVYNQRQQNLAIANQSAQALQMQGQEDSRIFNQKLAWLGFAMQADSYRTPEQQAQLQLQTAQIQNDMNLLNQSKLNDLSLYNQYATAKLKNQLEYELQDLNVKDPAQLKANLSRVLDQYYEEYWDIIQRPKQQVIDDVIAYAKANWISVAEALKKNFIEPLQSKPEYKSLLNKQTWYDPTAWQQSWVWVDNGDWTSSLKISWVGKVPDNLSRTQRVQEYTNIYNQVWEDVAGFSIALAQSIANGNTTWQCWAFANDYLKALWITNWFTDYLDEKMTKINQDYPTLWSVAIMDFWVKDKNWRPYWHVWIVSWINADWSVVITDSNWAWDEKKLTHTLSANDMKYVKWYYNPNADLNKNNNTAQWVTDNDIYNYNDSTLNRKLTAQQRQTVMEARNAVYSNPDSSIDDILRFSQGWKTPTDSTVQSLDKYAQALTSLWTITELLEWVDTWPIVWTLRENNPYDVKARQIQTAIAWLLPTLARWVYWEVWVLTDKDIEHYSRTVPNLRSTSEVNQAILAMTLDMLADWYKRKLSTQASLWYDVSWMAGIYQQIINKSSELMNGLWWTSKEDTTTNPIWWSPSYWLNFTSKY